MAEQMLMIDLISPCPRRMCNEGKGSVDTRRDRPSGGPGVRVRTPGDQPAVATPAAWSSLAGHAAPRSFPGPRARATHAGRSPGSQVIARRTPSRTHMSSGRSGNGRNPCDALTAYSCRDSHGVGHSKARPHHIPY